MRFVARQRRALPEIEGMLRRADPCLAPASGMFSRLAADEAMPPGERAMSARAPRRGGMTGAGQRPCRLRGLLGSCGRDLPVAGTSKGVSETARRGFAAGQVPASRGEKDSR
jgi:hypothetical protein